MRGKLPRNNGEAEGAIGGRLSSRRPGCLCSRAGPRVLPALASSKRTI